MITDKSNMLCILKVLEEYSDENHILSIRDIKEKLKALYDKDADRRTIYSAIAALSDFGYDISTYDENGEGYYLRERSFSAAEIRLLLDAVYSCKYISSRQSEELLEKIRSFLSVYERKKYSYTNIVNPDKKSPNPEVFLNIEILDQAINDRRKISFDYYKYDASKKLVKRRENRYTASPYAMVCDNEHYYLVLILDGYSDPSFYRVDMMKDIEISDEEISISKKEANLNTTRNVVYAYAGVPKSIELLCDETGLRYCIEKFGKDIVIQPKGGKYKVIITAALEGMPYWALQYIQHIEVTAPAELRESIVKAIKESNY
ncbi:MAG: WYL domain-containing protein [Firmicutes bacterium]|nr:WYL domain-containing protein [Bacillota bacterium]